MRPRQSAQTRVIAPAQLFILKLIERCNLACSYCYMFEFERDISATLPPVMSEAVVAKTLRRIKEHLCANKMQGCVLELHGGEPLMFGRQRLKQLVDTARAELSDFDVTVGLQTNAVLLNDEWLRDLS